MTLQVRIVKINSMQTKVEKLANSRVRLTVTVPGDVLAKHYELGIQKVSESLEIKGFRKGHAPKSLVIQKAGNQAVLREMIDLVLAETYYDAIREHKELVPVTQPTIDVKELKELEEMTYTAEVDVMPEVTVGEYKKIKVKAAVAPTTIDKTELDKTTTELKKVYGKDVPSRKAIEENLKQQKILQAKSATYDAIIEELLKRAKVDVPEAFIHSEIHHMERQIEMQAKAYGMTFDDWLKKEKKTHEDIHKDWRPQAEKAAQVGLILGRIAELEGIDPARSDASKLVLEKLHDYATK